jgi:cytochrome c oxidase assembly protein subunit 15
LVNHKLARTAFIAALLALTVIGLGAFTRLIDAGLGCPDWPGCYGHLTVPLTKAAQHVAQIIYAQKQFVGAKAWAEMIHRYFAGTLSLLILIIMVLVVDPRSARAGVFPKLNFYLVWGLIILVCYQILLGRWTVTLKLLPIIVTQHLLGGYLILSSLWLLYLNNKTTPHALLAIKINRGLKSILIFGLIGLALVISQIILGAWTSTNYASLSCPDFPFCHNTGAVLAPQFHQAFRIFSPVGINYDGGLLSAPARETIQMIHRLGALVVCVYWFVFAAVATIILRRYAFLLNKLYLILGLICVQICLGISNVILKLPVAIAVLHTLVAVMLLLCVLTFVFRLFQLQREIYQND